MAQTFTMEEVNASLGKKTFTMDEVNASIDPTFNVMGAEVGGGFGKALKLADDFVRSAAQGVTFGFADELAGSLDAALGIGERNQNIEKERARDEAIDPALRTAGEITGAVGAAAATLPRALAGGATLLGQSARGAATGAGAGALAGAGFAEGDALERAGPAAAGAGAGAFLGAAAPALISGVGRLVSGIRGAAKRPNVDKATRKAMIQLARNLERDEVTPQQALARLQTLGDDAILADVGGRNVQELAGSVASLPGRAKNRASRILNSRTSGQGARVDAILDDVLSGRNFNETLGDVIKSRAAKAQKLYGEALGSETAVKNEALQGLLENKTIKQAINAARGIDERLKGLPDNHIRVLDAAYKQVTGKAGEASRAGNGPRANALGDLRARLLDSISEEVPVYRRAVQTFADDSALKNALESGRKFIREDAEEIAAGLAKMTEGEREMFLVGATRAIKDKITATPDSANAARRIFGNDKIRTQLRSLFPNQKQFRKFQAAMLREAKFAETNNRVNPDIGSKTARTLAGQGDVLSDVAGVARDAAVGGTRGATLGILDRVGGRAVDAMRGRSNPAMADVLFSQGAEGNADLLRRLIESQAAARRSGALGAVGSVGAGQQGGDLVEQILQSLQ